MGQKTNPISLRLNINRNFDSCWYQEKSFEYSKLLQQDFKIRQYLKSLFQFVGIQTGRINIQIFPKKLLVHYYYHEKISNKIKNSGSNSNLGERNAAFRPQNSARPTSMLSLSNRMNTDISVLNFDINKSSKYKSSQPFKLIHSEETNPVGKVQFIMPWNLSRLFGFKVYLSKRNSNGTSFRNVPAIIETPLNISVNNSKSYLYFLVSQLVTRSISQKLKFINLETEKSNSLENSKFKSGTPFLIKEMKKRFFLRFYLTRFFSQSVGRDNSIFNKVLKLQAESFLEKSKLGTISRFSSLFGQTTARPAQLALQDSQKHIEAVLTKILKSNTSLYPLRIQSNYKSAQLLCEGICELLQQNIPFRQIYKQILSDIKKYEEIQGIRIVCSGRLGGVEMARVESKKYGQTSLHVFSSKIDFANHQAYTLYGLIGVKVWISYR